MVSVMEPLDTAEHLAEAIAGGRLDPQLWPRLLNLTALIRQALRSVSDFFVDHYRADPKHWLIAAAREGRVMPIFQIGETRTLRASFRRAAIRQGDGNNVFIDVVVTQHRPMVKEADDPQASFTGSEGDTLKAQQAVCCYWARSFPAVLADCLISFLAQVAPMALSEEGLEADGLRAENAPKLDAFKGRHAWRPHELGLLLSPLSRPQRRAAILLAHIFDSWAETSGGRHFLDVLNTASIQRPSLEEVFPAWLLGDLRLGETQLTAHLPAGFPVDRLHHGLSGWMHITGPWDLAMLWAPTGSVSLDSIEESPNGALDLLYHRAEAAAREMGLV